MKQIVGLVTPYVNRAHTKDELITGHKRRLRTAMPLGLGALRRFFVRLLCSSMEVREVSHVEAMLGDCPRVCALHHFHQGGREVREDLQRILQRPNTASGQPEEELLIAQVPVTTVSEHWHKSALSK